MRAPRLSAFLLSLVFVLGLAAPSPGAATRYRDTTAGAACHAANGALANKLTYNLNYLTNVGATDIVVICRLLTDDGGTVPDQLTRLRAEVLVPNAGATVTCMAQVGAFYDGTNFTYASQAQSHTALGPNAAVTIEWNTASLQRSQVWQTLTLNCKLPAGAKMGTIEHWEAPSDPY